MQLFVGRYLLFTSSLLIVFFKRRNQGYKTSLLARYWFVKKMSVIIQYAWVQARSPLILLFNERIRASLFYSLKGAVLHLNKA